MIPFFKFDLAVIGFTQAYENIAIRLTSILKLTKRGDAWESVLSFLLNILVLIMLLDHIIFHQNFWFDPPVALSIICNFLYAYKFTNK